MFSVTLCIRLHLIAQFIISACFHLVDLKNARACILIMLCVRQFLSQNSLKLVNISTIFNTLFVLIINNYEFRISNSIQLRFRFNLLKFEPNKAPSFTIIILMLKKCFSLIVFIIRLPNCFLNL